MFQIVLSASKIMSLIDTVINLHESHWQFRFEPVTDCLFCKWSSLIVNVIAEISFSHLNLCIKHYGMTITLFLVIILT